MSQKSKKQNKKEENNKEEVKKTELIWPGKRVEVEHVELPFQTIETINLPRGHKQEDIFSFPEQQKTVKSKKEQERLKKIVVPDTEWKNRLIWGDNLLVMGSLLKEFAGKINLIYIDPPFATGADFSFQVKIGDQEITKEPSALEVKAYRDTWGKGLQSYLQMMYDRLVLMKELLADDGSIYVHLDWHVGHYVKMIMDEVFGKDNFRNEIIWGYTRARPTGKYFARLHDDIFFYSKTNNYKFNKQKVPLSPTTQPPKRIVRSDGSVWERESFEKDMGDWWDITFHHRSPERVAYTTQKPRELLRRIIKTSSDKNDLFADFFCGSGTAGVVAEELGRKWIMCDIGRFAIHTTRKRLLDMGANPFVVQNLGKYERHRWVHKDGNLEDYIKFILELYRAEPVEEFKNLHGKKGNIFVRIGAVDAPVTLSEITQALEECRANKIKELDVLGWEWEMGLHDLIADEAKKYGVKLKTLQIPREVMELSIKDKDIRKEEMQFFELAYLDADVKVKDKTAMVTLKDFIIPNPDLLPDEVREKVKHWSDYIDYWAVDWMFNQHPEKWTEEDDTFHNMNQCYRTRKEPKLELSMKYKYKQKGKYNILVKVIDIFGNDTTKLIEVRI